jgi:AraC family transcriptional regulator
LAKIAVELERAIVQRRVNGTHGQTAGRLLAKGDGWAVEDIVCTCGPQDRPYEEQHTRVSIAVVAEGSFQYKSQAGHELMTPGSLLLGNPGQTFECAHEYGTGDRCLSFQYDPHYFESIAADAGAPSETMRFAVLCVPAVRSMSRLVARACGGLEGADAIGWEELAVRMAARTVVVASDFSPRHGEIPRSTVARVTRSVRAIEQRPEETLNLASLAREAGLSPYHFLRTFEMLMGVTPHQYLLRARLRRAAVRLVAERARVLDIALDCGFGDVSNFNRAFRREYGASPRSYRRQARGEKSCGPFEE